LWQGVVSFESFVGVEPEGGRKGESEGGREGGRGDSYFDMWMQAGREGEREGGRGVPWLEEAEEERVFAFLSPGVQVEEPELFEEVNEGGREGGGEGVDGEGLQEGGREGGASV